jgi:ectoine hydroxylase-related dioxygenase (phytanoyl-CoA dioxygenase family)
MTTIEKYNNDGYLVVKSLIDNETIDKIVEEIYEKHPENKNSNRIADAWKQYDSIGYLAFNKKIINILNHLYNKKPIPFQTLNFYSGTEQRVHSDQIHFCSEPINLMCGVWIALEDVSMDSGPLIYYPGSHKLPFYTMQRLGIETGNYGEYENKIEQKINKFGLAPKYGNIKKGDIIIWQANLVHGGSKRNNMNLTRKSIVIHYFFENCKYWTPLLSQPPNNIVYRDPNTFVDKKFDLKINDKYQIDEIVCAKNYKKKYSDLQHLTDEEAVEHYYKHGIYEKRRFYLHP